MKIKNKHTWYAKALNKKEAILEVVAQEFFRLILPEQPKTRWMREKNGESSQYYVLSKEIPDFQDKFFLFHENNRLILNGKVKGLAATQVLSLLLNEIDFKAGNVGVNHGQVIKIDGGLSFIKLNRSYNNLHQGKNLDITLADLKALPNLVNYEACNWLQQIWWDQKKKCVIKEEPVELDKCINQSPHFKNELYGTILRIISLPDQLIHYFVKSYTSNIINEDRLSNFITSRKKQLANAANQIPGYINYCQSNQAREEMLDYLNYLRNFKTMGSSVLLTNFEKQYTVNIEAIMPGGILNNFSRKLDAYHYRLSYTIDLNTEFNEDMLLQDRNKITPHIESLKKVISEYSTSATIIKKNELYIKLKLVLAELQRESIPENSLISEFISSIKLILKYDEEGKPTISKKLPSITTFSSITTFFRTPYFSYPQDTESTQCRAKKPALGVH